MSQRREAGEDPDYRFSLANERTFLAWIRTGLALLAGGAAVIALLPAVGSPLTRNAIGLVLLALALVMPLLAYRRWSSTESAIRAGRSLPEPGLLRLVSGGLTVVVLLVIALFVL